jgi:putative resolvase
LENLGHFIYFSKRNSMLLSISQASRILGVCTKTMRRWDENGMLTADCRTIGRHRRYSLERLKAFIEENEKVHKKRNKTIAKLQIHSHERAAIYARVSASKQREDLVRQAEFLLKKAREQGYSHELLYKYIASGLNDNRSGLKRLIRDAFAGKFSIIFITHKDRLARFGVSLLYQIFHLLGISIIEYPVDSQTTQEIQTPTSILVKDVLAILTSYSGKLYRLRRGAFT